eukprot:TRINITY_DN2468_c0_g1_i3.p1 TRINITY_DN2468_c0_g1~~TRINITY_DN2468_c0_g1_i3.p1  ORF type:complete len:288 (+),score=106.73 TRINITY_DN2468_c0_g1_i3:233-1096(+)
MGCCNSSEAKDIRQLERDVDGFREAREAECQARDGIATQFEVTATHHFGQPSDEDVRVAVMAMRAEHEQNAPLKEKSQVVSDQLKQTLATLANQWDGVVAARTKMETSAKDAASKAEKLRAAIKLLEEAPRDKKTKRELEEKVRTEELAHANQNAEHDRQVYSTMLNAWNKEKKGILKGGLEQFYTDWKEHLERESELCGEVLAKIELIDTLNIEVSKMGSVAFSGDGDVVPQAEEEEAAVPSEEHIKMLVNNPTEKRRAQFDDAFGEGAATKVLAERGVEPAPAKS